MADKANVTDIEVLERFRTSLLLFVEKASAQLNEVTEEVKRTRNWLQGEQRLALERDMKRKQKDLEQIEAEYFSARLSDLTQKKTGIQMMIRRKKREMREIEDKIRAAQAWLRHFDSKVEVEARKVDKLQNMLDSDISRAAQFLNEAAKALHDYSSNLEGPSTNS
jgi:DNA repair exonuclease SbcCD ATPase subunit